MPKQGNTPEPVKAQIINRFLEMSGEITTGELAKELNISVTSVSLVLTDYFQLKLRNR